MRWPLRSRCNQKFVQIALQVARVELRSNHGRNGRNSIEVHSPRSHHQIFWSQRTFEMFKTSLRPEWSHCARTALELCSQWSKPDQGALAKVAAWWKGGDRSSITASTPRSSLDLCEDSTTAVRSCFYHCERSSIAVRPKVTER